MNKTASIIGAAAQGEIAITAVLFSLGHGA
jgi:hypothetical protein